VNAGQEAELDEMCRRHGSKQHQRWLWRRLDWEESWRPQQHAPEMARSNLPAALCSFSIQRFYTDGWGACCDWWVTSAVEEANALQQVKAQSICTTDSSQRLARKDDPVF